MLSQKLFEEKLVEAMKARDAVRTQVLRAIKTRLMNEKINKGDELTEEEILKLLQSEVKRRKESAESFASGGRADMADNENAEIVIITEFLPAQVSEAEITAKIDGIIKENGFVKSDFGKAMTLLKEHFGATADGSVISSILKTKLQ